MSALDVRRRHYSDGRVRTADAGRGIAISNPIRLSLAAGLKEHRVLNQLHFALIMIIERVEQG